LFLSSVGFSRELDRSCGRSLTRGPQRYIFGGRQAVEGEFPWMVFAIKHNGHFCGGSIITAYFVLTAAHCLDSFKSKCLHDRSIKSRSLGYHSCVLQVRDFIIHEGYGSHMKNDIALLRLREPFNLKKSRGRIATVCLPIKDVKPSTTITVSGWGRLTEDGRLPNVLRAVDVKVRQNSFCSIDETKFIPRTMFCAGNNEKDTCDRDSGSPAVQRKRGVAFQVGIVSFGGPCGDDHGYYTRVVSYSKWIEYNIHTAHVV
ncbi:secreted serine protease, putative, partial [Ixodes scapularis]